MAKEQSVGGVAFFFGFLSLVFVLVLLIIFMLLFIRGAEIARLPTFALSLLVGFIASKFFITRNNGVYFHECRHAFVSGLVGNKAVKMEVERKTGSFEYKYSKDTAKYNALISLAPYTLPLWSVLSFVLVLIAPLPATILIGLGLGADVEQWWRDLSPHQSDLTQITGGVLVGILFVVVSELVTIALLTSVALLGAGFFPAFGEYLLLLAAYFSKSLLNKP